MKRAAARVRALLRLALVIALTSFAFALFFFLAMLLYGLGMPEYGLLGFLPAGALFSVAGALFGTIISLDDGTSGNAPLKPSIRKLGARRLRVALCALWGALAVVVADALFRQPVSVPPILIGSAVGATLGWFGWRWAKYVDF